MKTISFSKMKERFLRDEETRGEYERLAPEFALIEAVIAKRIQKGMTQKDLATRAHTTQSAISRLESGSSNPSFAFLKKISEALSSELVVSFR